MPAVLAAAAASAHPQAPVPLVFAARPAQPRVDRSFIRRVTPPAVEVDAVAVQPAAVKPPAKPAVKPVKLAAKPAAPKLQHVARTAAVARVEAPPVEASGSAAVIVRFVLAQVGESYRMGATGPGAWDCSGLTQAAARLVGVSLPHSADAQRGYGRAVTRAQLQPGDLVFWPGHVGVAIGGGMMVAAANTREGVVRQRIYGTPVAYRRIVG